MDIAYGGGMNWIRGMERRRVWLWLVWPMAVAVLPYAIVHGVARVRGWGVYWTLDWSAASIAAAAVVMLGPPALLELLMFRDAGKRQ